MGRTPSPTDSPHGTEMAGLWLGFLECSCLLQSIPRASALRALRGGMQMGDPGCVCHGPSIQATSWEEGMSARWHCCLSRRPPGCSSLLCTCSRSRTLAFPHPLCQQTRTELWTLALKGVTKPKQQQRWAWPGLTGLAWSTHGRRSHCHSLLPGSQSMGLVANRPPLC